jgi:hypothetical protein
MRTVFRLQARSAPELEIRLVHDGRRIQAGPAGSGELEVRSTAQVVVNELEKVGACRTIACADPGQERLKAV